MRKALTGSLAELSPETWRGQRGVLFDGLGIFKAWVKIRAWMVSRPIKSVISRVKDLVYRIWGSFALT